jgi:methionyl aminopeptidase
VIIDSTTKREAMTAGGRIAAQVLAEVLAKVEPGINTQELDQLAERKIKDAGAEPSFKGFKDYPFATCININEGVVHGFPRADLIVKKGDLVTVDLGVHYQGFHTDTAHTIEVESFRHQEFLAVGRKALKNAIDNCRVGKRIGDVSWEIQRTIEGANFYVFEELVGHGVGKKLHEKPSVPGYGEPNSGLKIKAGMTLAVEVIYALEETALERLDDGWTLITATGCPAAMFEHTIFVTESGPIVLTLQR